MQFSVGDKVVHPHHGPGLIASMERKELLDGKKRYYVIQIPTKELTVYVPRRTVDQIGVRPAMSRARLSIVLDMLRSRPRNLPEDYKERQEVVWEKLKTGRVMQTAEVVRDLSWHGERAHLTKKDSEFLARGTRWLAAEMALVSNADISDVEQIIETALAVAMATAVAGEQVH